MGLLAASCKFLADSRETSLMLGGKIANFFLPFAVKIHPQQICILQDRAP